MLALDSDKRPGRSAPPTVCHPPSDSFTFVRECLSPRSSRKQWLMTFDLQPPPSYYPPHMGITIPTEPSAAMLNLSALVYLMGISIITWCIARTTENYCLFSRESLRTMPWPRLCLLLTFVDSWLYLFLSMCHPVHSRFLNLTMIRQLG